MDLSKLLSLVSTRAAAGIGIVALAAGAGSAVVLTTKPASTHQTQTVVSTETTTSESSSEESSSAEDVSSEHSTSDANTSNHGEVVTAAVSSCKSSAAAAHTHGIGDCVSDVASTNGQAHRHSSSETSSSH